MRTYLVIAAFALAAGCASKNDTAAVDATGAANTGVQTAQVVKGSQADLEQSAGNMVYFGYDQYSLTAQGQAALRRQAEWLQNNPSVKVQLAGNCDERGTREYNLALGARRAQAAHDYLVSLGVNPARLSTKSNGKENPVAYGSDESAWSQNRNAMTTVTGASS